MLVGRPDDASAEFVTLEGRTSKGFAVVLRLVDGEIRGLEARASMWCPYAKKWGGIQWTQTGSFRQDGDRVSVRWREVRRKTRERMRFLMRAQLAGDRDSAVGTITGRWRSGPYACRGTVRFSARKSS